MKNEISITIRITKKQKEFLDMVAHLNGLSNSRIIRDLIDDMILYMSQGEEVNENE